MHIFLFVLSIFWTLVAVVCFLNAMGHSQTGVFSEIESVIAFTCAAVCLAGAGIIERLISVNKTLLTFLNAMCEVDESASEPKDKKEADNQAEYLG